MMSEQALAEKEGAEAAWQEALARIEAARREGGVRVDLSDLAIQDIPAELLALAPTLEALNLGDTEISDAAPLGALTNLTVLDLHFTKISDATPLGALTNLTVLELGGTDISDATPLGALTNLITLNLHRTKISDAAPLGGLTNLALLYLGGTDIRDAAPLGGLTNLTRLDLNGTKISDAAPLGALSNLTRLELSGTKISDAAFLGTLTELDSLDVADTAIRDLRPLRSLSPLKGSKSWGLFFAGSAATRFDPELARLSQIQDHAARTEQVLAYLNALDDDEYDRRLLADATPAQAPAPLMPVWTDDGQMDNAPETLDQDQLARAAWTSLHGLAHSLDIDRLANHAPQVKTAIEQLRHGLGANYEGLNPIHTGIFAEIAAKTIGGMDMAIFGDDAPFFQAFAMEALRLIQRFETWRAYTAQAAPPVAEGDFRAMVETGRHIREVFDDADLLSERLFADWGNLDRVALADPTDEKAIQAAWRVSLNNVLAKFMNKIVIPGAAEGLKSIVKIITYGVFVALFDWFLILATGYPGLFGWLKMAAPILKSLVKAP